MTSDAQHAKPTEDKHLGSPGGNIALGVVCLVVGILALGHGYTATIPLIAGPIILLYGIGQAVRRSSHSGTRGKP